MNKEQIVELIEKNMKENQEALDHFNAKAKEIQEVIKNQKNNLTSTIELATMKDRALFHKTAVLVYKDLLEEIEK